MISPGCLPTCYPMPGEYYGKSSIQRALVTGATGATLESCAKQNGLVAPAKAYAILQSRLEQRVRGQVKFDGLSHSSDAYHRQQGEPQLSKSGSERDADLSTGA